MKVLLVSSSFLPKVDGSTRCVHDHARKLAARGDTVYLSTRGIAGSPREEVLDGFKVERSWVAFRSGTPLGKASLVLAQMLSILVLQGRHRFDVIHVHGYISGLAALPCRLVWRVPVVITTHGTELLWPRQLWWKSSAEVKLGLIFERFVLRHCDVVVAQSEGVRDYMLRIYGRSFEGRIRLIHTGVDHMKFRAPPLDKGRGRVLFIGALSEIKGVSCLLKAFAGAHRRVPGSRLVLVGSGPMAESYRRLAGELGVKDSVEFCGTVRDDARLVQLYSDSDVVVLPSNVGGPISCTVMEGLSCGRAVVSTDVPGGIPDVLAGGVGLLMKREDCAALEGYLTMLMTDDARLSRLGAGARAAVEEMYTLDSMADKLEALYAELST